MAGRGKEFHMDFLLNASVNGGFRGSFSKAQAEFARLGKEIQGVHKLQGDISSYQKQQAAVEKTSAKLKNLQAQEAQLKKELEAVQKAEGQDAAAAARLKREKLKLEQQIKNTSTALETQQQKLKGTEDRLKGAGVDTANLAQKDAELTAKLKELQAEQDKAADSAANFGDRAAQGISAVGEAIAAAGIAAALKEITDAYVECVGVAADFQESMSTVEALSQANAQEMAALTAEAKELGATTKFTAQEAGDAMGYMAMAGWDATDMLQGMDGVLQLAAASGEDLAMVSDIVTDSLSAFGLTAADTAHFSDVLAAAATNSNTNVAIMGETFKMSASVAGALGYSIEDVAVAMGLMANSGVKGSIAGTALRNTFNGLLEGVTLTGAAFGEYEYSAVKADGTMKGFGATIDELRGYFEQMTEAERVANAQAIAGQRGYNGLLAILNATDADYASLTGSINDCSGAAERMAKIKLDNLNGQLTLMNSAWDALKTTIGEEFNPELQSLAEIGTDVLTWVNDFVQEHPALVKGVMAGAGAFGALAFGITGVTAAMKLASAASAIFAGTMGVALGPVVAVTAAVAGVVGVVTALTTAANEGVPSVKELTEAAQNMGEAMDEAGAAYDQTATQTAATAEVAGLYIDKLEEIEAATDGAVQRNQEYHNILALLTRTVPELADYIDLENNAIEGGTEALREHTEAWKKDAETQAYQEYLNSLYDEYGAVMTESAENSIKLTQAQIKLETAEKNCDAAMERMNELSTQACENGELLSDEYYQLEDSFYGYTNEIYTAQREIDNLNKAIDADAESVAAAKAEIDSAEEAVEQLTGVTEEQAAAEGEAAAQTQELQGAIESTMTEVAALVEAYEEAYTAALESVQGQYEIWDEAADVVATSAGTINGALESQVSYWQNYNQNLEALRERSADIEGLSDVIASFADGSTDSVNAIAGMASASDEDLAAMVENWQDLQQAQADASESIAELKTDFSEQMDELQDALADDIEAMDLGDEAAASGRATIQSYIDGANAMLPAVRSMYDRLARAAVSALGPMPYSDSAYAANSSRGYASGTQNAAPGWAEVGENGPELMFFHGGEKVLNAAQTSVLRARAAPAVSALPVSSGGGGLPPIQIIIQVSGEPTPEAATALRDSAGAIADEVVVRVMDLLEEQEADARRSAFV